MHEITLQVLLAFADHHQLPAETPICIGAAADGSDAKPCGSMLATHHDDGTSSLTVTVEND